MSVFLKELDTYKRNYDILGIYRESLIATLKQQYKNQTEETIATFVNKLIEAKLKSPEMKVLKRKHRGDKQITTIDFLKYTEWVAENKHILGCNFVTYMNPAVEESFIGEFIKMNLAMRKKVKKDGQLAGIRGDKEFATFCNLVQSNFKIRINSISGALSSPYNPLYNASGHTGLTSITRATTSYANALNERMSASNRHYFNQETVFNELSYVILNTDENLVEDTMFKFKLDAPSNEACMKIITDSSKEYWQADDVMANIKKLVISMSPQQKSMFAYQMDLSAMCEYSGTTLRNMFAKILRVTPPVTDKAEIDNLFKTASENSASLASILCSDWIKGISVRDLDDEQRGKWAARAKVVMEVMEEYRELFSVFFANGFMPANIYSIPNAVRKVVVGSDTDSTIYTTQRQIKWYTGKLDDSPLSLSVGAITAFISSELTAELLVRMSANMGIDKKNLQTVTMKPEVVSLGQVNTQKAKHYVMDKSVVEGNVYADEHVEIEIKGVGLRSSKFPKVIRSESEKFMRMVLKLPLRETKVKPINIASVMANIEHTLSRNIEKGDQTLLQTERINKPEAYARANDHHTLAYEFWNSVFGNKYGRIEELPTSTLKVSVTVGNKKALLKWIDTLDPYQRKQAHEFIIRHNKLYFTNILVPQHALENGMIKEIVPIIDKRKMLGQLMKPFYTISTGMNLNILNTNLTRFWSDEITEEQSLANLPEGYVIEI
jgi:hypothetical protein